MVYKIKKSWKERELMQIRKKYKGKIPPFKVISREGTRLFLKVPSKIHKKGAIVTYKNRPAIVKKVTRKGVHLQRFKKTNGLTSPEKKITYVPHKTYDRLPIYPSYPLVAT